MNKSLYSILLLICATVAGCTFAHGADRPSDRPSGGSIDSPDGRLRMEIYTDDTTAGGNLTYRITADGQNVVLPSKLNVTMADRNGMGRWNAIPKTKALKYSPVFTVDTTWHPPFGEQSEYRDHYNTMRVTVPGCAVQIVVRAYNEGIAFRYDIPGEDLIVRIEQESTEFNMPSGTEAWINSHPQDRYVKRPLKGSMQVEMPLTMQLEGGKYLSLLESELVHYSRARIRTVGADSLKINIDSPVVSGSPMRSPWRVVMVADRPAELLQNNSLVLNLSPAAAISTDWIKPGKVIREITLNTKTAKECVDFAASQNIQYIHFDAGWYGHEYVQAADATTVDVDPDRNPINDLNLLDVVNYGKSRGVGVILYVNRRQLEKNLDVILPLYKSWGIKGVKYGFINTGTHRWVEWVEEAVRKAADNQLLVNIHDEYRPTGLSRTYPNLLTQEGIRGNEEMPDADHNTALPFTRFLSGAGDYTYCYYTRAELGHPKRHVMNTPAHQLTLPIIYYSPLQYLYWYDRPSDFGNEPELALWRAIPTVWDQTEVLDGAIGEFATVARRSGRDWFVGMITNTSERTLKTPLTFLEKGKKYRLTRYSDGPESLPSRTKVDVQQITVKGGDIVTSTLKASGGESWHIVPLD